jgi:dienelactone hydrolase
MKDNGDHAMSSRAFVSVVVLAISLLTVAAAPSARPVAPAIALPYAPQRKLLPTDTIRLDWKDASRGREVPVKIYFPTQGSGPFPVIIFSHGLGGTREAYEYLGRQWAANGYVSVHLQHRGSDDTAWRGKSQPARSMARAANPKNALDRDKDVKFAIDQLDSLNKTGPRVAGKLDLNSIGMAGHSFGAETTLLIAGQRFGGAAMTQHISATLPDNRVKAAMPMSASVPAMQNSLDDMFAQIHIPIFYMTGTLDDSPLGDTKAGQRRMVYDYTANSTAAYLLTLTNGDHMTFSGHVQPAEWPRDSELQNLIRLASTAFWDAYLRNDPAAKKWLSEGEFTQALGDDGVLEHK